MPIPISPEMIPYLCGIGGPALGLAGFAIYKIRARKIRKIFEIYEHNTGNNPSNPIHQAKAAEASQNYTRLTGQSIEDAVKEDHAKFHSKSEKLKKQRSRRTPH